MQVGHLMSEVALQVAGVMAPALAVLGIGYLRQAVAKIKDERYRQLAWEAMVYAERRFASGPERLDYVTRYLARRTGLPPRRLRHLIESLVAEVEREMGRGAYPVSAAP